MSETPTPELTLGEVLKNRRTALGRSVEQFSALTRIHHKTLTALEANDYLTLPARAFTRGFIITYAKALGLNGDDLVKHYQDFLEKKFAEKPDREKGHEGYVFESKEIEQNRRWTIIVATTAAVFAIVVLLVFKPQNHKRKEKHKEFTEEALNGTEPIVEEESGAIGLPLASPTIAALKAPPVTTSSVEHPKTTAASEPTVAPPSKVVAADASETASVPTSPSPSPVAKASPSPSPTGSPAVALDQLNKGDDLTPKEVKKKITLQSLDDVWVRYKVDEKPPMLLMLRKGKFLVVKAKQKLQFDTSTAKNLNLRTKNSAIFKNLELNSFEVDASGNPTPLVGGVTGAPKIPQ